jgi:hypothetical protein
MLLNQGCKHEPIGGFVDPGVDPTDTIPGDTTVLNPCDDDVVYFSKDVLPILISNCSVPGCHDAVSREKDIVLTSYENVIQTADVRPFDLDGGKLFEMITESDPDDRMPPPPRVPLNADQINTIRQWILQGAQDLTCDEPMECITTDVSFSQTVYPIIETNCRGCHSGPSPTGGISLENYSAIRSIAATGRLYGAIAWQPGFTPMPLNRGPLADCDIQQIKSWIDSGMPEN